MKRRETAILYFVDELKAEADIAIVVMQKAAKIARDLHAHSELMRHMLATARKVKDKPMAEAVETVVREWMDAWNLPRAEWPQLEQEMIIFTQAFHVFANRPDAEADLILRNACAALEAGFVREGTRLCDEMAWRSKCAHGWWEVVSPQPPAMTGSKPRPTIPAFEPGQPFWEAGCAPFCR